MRECAVGVVLWGTVHGGEAVPVCEQRGDVSANCHSTGDRAGRLGLPSGIAGIETASVTAGTEMDI